MIKRITGFAIIFIMLLVSSNSNIVAASKNSKLVSFPWEKTNVLSSGTNSESLQVFPIPTSVPIPTSTPEPTPEPITVPEITSAPAPTYAPIFPTAIPTSIPISVPIPTQAPEPVIAASSGSYEDRLWDVVQNWRISQGLAAHAKDSRMCRLAELRLPEIKVNWSHDGFVNNSHYSAICPDSNCFASMSENLSNGYYSEQENLNGWLNSPAHREALQKNYTYSCIKCQDGYCVQEFAS